MKDTYCNLAHDAVLALDVVSSILFGKAGGLAAIAGSMCARLRDLDAAHSAPAEMEEAHAESPQVDRLDRVFAAAPADGPHGRSYGTIPTNVKRAKRLRLVGVDAMGRKTGYVDEGTAAELAGRNKIAPSTIYRIAKSGAVVNGFRVERILE